jgi:hypothetical protein
MRRFTVVAALTAAGLATGCGIAGERPEGYEKRDYHVDPSIKFRPVSLAEIVRNPQWNAGVEFDAIFNRRDENVWQAYYTPFRAGEYKSFSVWPADAQMWDSRGRGRSIPTPRGGDSPEVTGCTRPRDRRSASAASLKSVDSRPDQVYYPTRSIALVHRRIARQLIRGLDEAGPTRPRDDAARRRDRRRGLAPRATRGGRWAGSAQREFSDAESCYGRAPT